ncbi:hypothetical protein [Rickettsia endosymbiont of Cardiosporidium cionae]|uniref:hypothetical protein n=1 Tax=Rickettsia endosymbiont of Cardiosporidium cionae TaxID=2777155 RepID=UPI0018935C7A|nr:hypothetical protein [Rickettsia endosymbiont of Cardiosporidium cionae]KAF8818557.1 hypothetical protein IHI24_000273 [Rickettsia endosymbiont of Cardiosporidium cionae]
MEKFLKTIQVSIMFILIYTTAQANLGDNIEKSGEIKLKNRIVFEEIINEYKAYLTTLPLEVIEEIIEYRQNIANINKQKIELFRQLSQEAQIHLQREQEFKKQLPINSQDLLG